MTKLAAGSPHTQTSDAYGKDVVDDRSPSYRLLHSSGEQIFRDLTKACAALRQHPGARLFVGSSRA